MTLQPFGKWLRECDVPVGAILEGGYSDELPRLIDAFSQQLGKSERE